MPLVQVIVLYDEPELAEQFAQELGTYAKHSPSRFPNPHWTVFSIVRLRTG